MSFDHLPILGMWNLNEVWAVNRKIRFAKLYYELSCGELSRGEHWTVHNMNYWISLFKDIYYMNILKIGHLKVEYPKIDTLNILNLGHSLS